MHVSARSRRCPRGPTETAECWYLPNTTSRSSISGYSPVWATRGEMGMNGEPDLYIGAQWRHASDGATRAVINPADGSTAAVVDEATPSDARDAVAAARAAVD